MATNNKATTPRAVWLGRLACMLALCSVTAVLGFLAHHFLTASERSLARTQYESVTDRALTEAASLVNSVRWSLVTLARTIGTLHPDAEAWPFVVVPNYEVTVRSLLRASSGEGMSFFVLVQPEEATEWEEFVYDYYYNKRDPPFPPGTAESSFGRGIFGIDDPNETKTPDGRYHDTTGVPVYDSILGDEPILAPILHSDKGADDRVLMLNGRFEPTRGRPIDDMIQCTRNRSSGNTSTSNSEVVSQCGVISDLVTLLKKGRGAGAFIAQPVFPMNNATTVTSGIAALLVWDEIFEHTFNSEVRGIDCVLEVGDKAFTYQVVDGEASVVGEGDLHDRNYDHLKRTVVLTEDDLYSDNSPVYKLSIYPNAAFYEVYSTGNATTAVFVIIAATLITSTVFILYDFFVRREFNTKSKLLEAKRRYMRYISHEVRTPLSSVFMGLSVVQNALALSLGFKSAAALEERLASDMSSNKHDKDGNATPCENSPRRCSSPTMMNTSSCCDHNKKQIFDCFKLTREIQQQAQEAVDVLSDLLMYDKIESGSFQLELVSIPIWQLVERTANEFRLAAVKKKIGLEVLFGDDNQETDEESTAKLTSLEHVSDKLQTLILVGDRVRIQQVLRNIISNAVKFTSEGGTIAVHAIWILPAKEHDQDNESSEDIEFKDGKRMALKTGGYIRVQVQDTGAGMTAEQLERLYGDGVQFNVDQLQSGGGSGLGLFITKDIVQQHRGTLKASSDGLGKGSSFTLTLPLHVVPIEALDGLKASMSTVELDGSDNTEHTISKKPNDTDKLKSNQQFRVLIVEDVLSNRKLLNRILTIEGHSCGEAADGVVAVQMLTAAKANGKELYDIILLDYELPRMSGPETAREVRRLGFTMPIVGVTGNILGDDIDHFKSAGANAVLPKPFQIADFDEVCVELGLV